MLPRSGQVIGEQLRCFFSRYFVRLFSLFCLLVWSSVSGATAEGAEGGSVSSRKISSQFAVPPGLRGHVEFWKTVFGKYGKHQQVFHYRGHPGVIYSVLDFADAGKTLGPVQLERLMESAAESEVERIRGRLRLLAEGRPPATAFDHRVVKLFSTYDRATRAAYREAMVDRGIRYQVGIREKTSDGIKRSGRFLFAIEQIFAEYGLPWELTRLPLVESSFDYNAYSSVGAAGIWQFMRGTAKKYMRVDSYVDERRDPIQASRAAAQYLGHAYRQLGNWALALTSYNHGITGVMRAVKATGSRDIVTIIERYEGDSFGFASQNFYAEFLAALEIERNYQQYFPDLVREQPLAFDEVHLHVPASVGAVKRAARITDEMLEELNPQLLRPVLSGRVQIPRGVAIKLPAGRGAAVTAALGQGQLYAFVPSDERKQMSVGVGRDKPVSGDMPVAAEAAPTVIAKSEVSAEQLRSETKSSAKPTGTRRYVVKPGDTLSEIANTHKLSLSALKRLNPKVGNKIKPGQQMNVK